MANQTIYPYGTGGSMPDGYSIVNDLTTGGTNKALSAEMGKHLGPIDDLVEDTTLNIEQTWTTGSYYKNYNHITVGSTYDGYDTDTNSNGRRVKVTAKAGDTVTIWTYNVPNVAYPYVICDSSNKVTYASAKSSSATGYTITKANPAVLQIESDCYIYINSWNGGDYGCVIERPARVLVAADSTHNGIMTKEHVATLNNVGGEDWTILKSYLEDTEDNIVVEYTQGKAWINYNHSLGDTYVGSMTDQTNSAAAKVAVQAGDTVTLWAGAVNNTEFPYIITNSNNVIVKLSPKSSSATPYTIPQSNPVVVEIEVDGYIYLGASIEGGYGCTITRPKRVIYNATSERDGLMPKEIMALFGDEGSVSGSEVSLKLKTFAFIGDSFSAPNSWQSTMCSDLGAIKSTNEAVSGGAWHGTDSLSAYYQAQQLASGSLEYDYILCVLGTNDVAHWDSYTLGSINYTSQTIGTASGNINPSNSITEGIQATLMTLKRAFPNAIIKIGYTPAGYIHDANTSIPNVISLCERMKELAYMYGVGYIETRSCGICRWMDEDLHTYTGTTAYGEWTSTGHPSGAGQTRIGHYMARIMMSNL